MITVFVPMMLLLVVLGLILGVFLLTKWRRKRKGKRKGFEDLLLRSPGHSLCREIQDISEDINADFGTAFICLLFFYSGYLNLTRATPVKNSMNFLFWAIAILVILYLLYRIWANINRRAKKRIGLAGEIAAGEELNRLMLDGYHVYHDFPADRFNIDHVLVGSSGVFAVETKARSKGSRGKRTNAAKVIYDGESLIFPSCTTREPVDQAKAQAAWLSKWMSGAVGDPVKAKPMVTIPGWYIERKSPNCVAVLNPKQVKAYLDGKKETVLSENVIKRICHQLEQKCRDVDVWEWY
jgi:preprotein translocase subunit YajC